MKNVFRIFTLVLLCSLIAMSGCDAPDDSNSENDPSQDEVIESKGVIGMTCMDLSNPFFRLIADVMTEEAAKHGYEVICLDGANTASKQDTQLNDFVARKCSAIFLNPVDSNAVGAGVKKAHEAGIPVFTFDVQVTEEEAREMVVSHIGSDNFQGGRLAGESMMEVTGDTGQIAIISYPEITSCQLRVAGFRDYLEENNSQLEIVTELSGRGNINDAVNTATDILQTNNNLVGIFAINDPSARGAYSAVSSATRTDQITIIGFDASPEGKEAVFAGRLYDTPRQFPEKMAIGTVESFISYLDGRAVEDQIFIPCSHYKYEDAVADTNRSGW